MELTGTNTQFKQVPTGSYGKGDSVNVEFAQTLNAQSGQYALSLGCTGYEGDTMVVYHRLYDIILFETVSAMPMVGCYDWTAKSKFRGRERQLATTVSCSRGGDAVAAGRIHALTGAATNRRDRRQTTACPPKPWRRREDERHGPSCARTFTEGRRQKTEGKQRRMDPPSPECYGGQVGIWQLSTSNTIKGRMPIQMAPLRTNS